MAKRKVVILSENEGVEDENSSRPVRKAKPSQKQAQLDNEALNAEEKKLEALQRDLQKRRQEVKQARRASVAKVENGEDEDFESEEEDDPPLGQGFSCSIQPLNATYAVPSQPRGELRRVGAATTGIFESGKPAEVPRISAKAFKTLRPSDRTDTDDEEPPASSENPSSSPASASATSSSQPSVASSTLPLQPTTSPNVEKKMPAFRTGVVVNPKKPRAADYEDIVQALIIRAASEYEALVCTKDAFPSTAMRNKWASKVWKNANRDADEDYQITDAISSLIRQRGSHIRGHALFLIRPYLISTLGFKRGPDASIVVANQQLAQKLKPASGPRFMFESLDDRSGYGEAKIISTIIEAVWFEDARSQGVVFKQLFNPIPLETMALVFTIIDFCIDEWSTGQVVKGKMWESSVIERHKVFRLDLEGWSQINQIAVAGIRKKLYARASRNAGVNDSSAARQTLVGDVLERAKQELDGRTGETDSEAEN